MNKDFLPFEVDLKDKVVVITGAAGLICGELATAIAACGAKVAVLDLNQEKADAKAKEIVDAGGCAKGFAANVLSKEALAACHERVLKELGPCDILINGAGGNSPKATTTEEHYGDLKGQEDVITFFDLKEEGVQFVFNLNFLGTLLPTQEFAKDMLGREGCSILNISSMNAYTPLTKIPAYSAAKAGISNFTQWLAVHFAKEGIRVNAIAPGFFSTAQNKALLWNPDGTPTARTGKILAATPMGRFGEVSELVGSTLFLVSDKAAGFITGVVLPIDGGFSAYSGV